ncbi:MAG: TetR family transcriptional regulator [Micrococcales bacterium]|nr:TetR family transcriptional regulator [Micrococcales bacterium]
MIPSTGKGEQRRRDITDAAAALLLESGPTAVSHRAVARRAGCSLSATTYYFKGLDDLLQAAGEHNIARWAQRAEQVAERVEAGPIPMARAETVRSILAATLPSDEALLGHYLTLLAAGGSPPVARAYRTGRARLNAAILRVLRRVGSPLSVELVIAVVDGAAVSALSEGRDVWTTAERALTQLQEASAPTT